MTIQAKNKPTNGKRHRLSPRKMNSAINDAYLRFKLDLLEESTQPGTMLPGENEFIRRYQTPLSVARGVFRKLKEEGLAESIRGKGVFLIKAPTQDKQVNQFKKHLNIGIVAFLQVEHPEARFNRVSEVLRQFDQQSGINHCQTTLYNTYINPLEDLESLESIHNDRPDGILYVPTQTGEKADSIRKLRMLGIPMVVAGTNTDLVSSVTFDHYQTAYSAIEHLVKLGHQKIAFIQAEGNEFWQVDRLNGMKDCLEKYQVPVQNKLIFRLPIPTSKQWLEKDGPSIIKKLVKENCTAVFCSGDTIATSLIDHTNNTGLTIPGDLSVVGIGDYWKLRSYDLTTIQQADTELGYAGFNLLTEIIRAQPESPIHRKLNCPLLIRNTTAPKKEE